MSRWLYGLLIVSVGFTFLLLASFQAENFPFKSKRIVNIHYMGLDGEETSLPLWCSTCALVGTSGHMLEREYGSEIDGNRCVFRMGFSPSRGKELNVGSRTTARIVDSFSFFPFLKRPMKLVTGPFRSKVWILYDRRAGDISYFHRPRLSKISQKRDTKFLWMTKSAETEVYEALKNETGNKKLKSLSALWYALKVVQDAGCSSLDIYGIPDHQLCKRDDDVGVMSLYWDNTSVPLCMHGVDASTIFEKKVPPVSSFASVTERRALLTWKHRDITNLRFIAPEWSHWLF